ncbi:MAG: hypothetical protein EAZ24_15650, partial [Burkholderiales bacterium]
HLIRQLRAHQDSIGAPEIARRSVRSCWRHQGVEEFCVHAWRIAVGVKENTLRSERFIVSLACRVHSEICRFKSLRSVDVPDVRDWFSARLG